ncbi:hypothetical protein PLICRDRAFT_40443 [Plicaturopsis crispa FD-325 SS-3]|nr:hypothetical protein PLICRDRAFT_40443 [Plicaturopsis crispa FD-325 SS-3]
MQTGNHPLPIFPDVESPLVFRETIDFNLHYNPQLPFYRFSRDGSDRIEEISQLEFGRAAHRVAHIIRPEREGQDGRVVGIIAHTDTLVYQASVAGIVVAGLTAFPISNRNSPAAVVHLLRKTQCHQLLVSPSTHSLIEAIRSELAADTEPFELTLTEVPSLSRIYPRLCAERAEDPFIEYPPPKERPLLDDIIYYIHSSGSTGFPKAIPQTSRVIHDWNNMPVFLDIKRHRHWRLAAMALPPFHLFGVFMQMLVPMYALSGVGVYPPMSSENDPQALPIVPTSDNMLDHVRRTQSNVIIMVPSVIELWERSEEGVELLKAAELVAYGGGPLATKTGDALIKAGVRLRSLYGATEFGPPTYFLPRNPVDAECWNWLRFHSNTNIRWADQGDGTYELQFLKCSTHTLAHENFPGGYATSDLFEKHPEHEGLYRIVGRLDDVIILASGEKTVPGPMEVIMRSSPLIKDAMMFGRERAQVGVLVEPHDDHKFDPKDEEALAAFRNAIWPIVEHANQDAPTFSRIFKEMIIVTTPGKPLPRTPKGTVQRKIALKEYESEITALYDTIDAASTSGGAVEPPLTWSADHVERFLVEQSRDIHEGREISSETDLFGQGFDSLSATFLRNRIISALRRSQDPSTQRAVGLVTQNIVFANPTIKQLAEHLASLVAYPGSGDGVVASEGATRIEKMIEKYSVGLGGPQLKGPADPEPVVLLTGSTGSLGSHLLQMLLVDHKVKRVYTFNRRASGKSLAQRQTEAFADKGFDLGLLKLEKLRLVEADAAQEQFGLPSAEYDELLQSVTVIIHNAWRLDFNLSLSSFEPNVRGTRNLIDFALASPHANQFRFVFTSSVGTTQSWDKSKGPYPEEVQYDARYAVGAGYGEGKYVSERILAKSGLQGTSIRIGQVAGGRPNGAWATTDWVPIFVKSSIALGALPDAQGLLTWTPMHAVSQGVLDIAFTQSTPPPAINLVHPSPVEWNFVMKTISQTLSEVLHIDSLPLSPFGQWFTKLEARAKNATEDDIKRIPAIKLLEFFRALSSTDKGIRASGRTDVEAAGMAPLAIEKLRATSPSMATLQPLGVDDVQSWIHYWASTGLFD